MQLAPEVREPGVGSPRSVLAAPRLAGPCEPMFLCVASRMDPGQTHVRAGLRAGEARAGVGFDIDWGVLRP